MTVNTNHVTYTHDEILQSGTPFQRFQTQRLDEVEATLKEIRDSQLATQKMVTEFIESMSKNPMLGAMAKMMGGKRT